MTPPVAHAQVERLLEHSAWVRSLARHLVRDAALADDLVQKTWLAAVEDPPGEGQPMRRWLGAVLRNLARQESRGEGRRTEREALAARPEAVPSTSDVVERAAMQRELVEAVLALDEPYRTTILLRFFDELPPRAVAKRMGVPVETVRTRTARAIARLRETLDRGHGGDRGAWLAAILPLARPPSSLSPTLAGAALVNAKIQITIAALAVAGALTAYLASQSSGDPSPALASAPAGPAIASPLAGTEPGGSTLSAEPTGPASASARAAAPAAAEPAITAKPALLRGRVLDEKGSPAAGVRIALEGPRNGDARAAGKEADGRLATSGQDGAFEMPFPEGGGDGGRLVAADERFATVLAGVVGSAPGKNLPVVVIAPRVAVGGRVVAEEGYPLPGARVEVHVPEEVRTRFRTVLDRSASLSWAVLADAHGAFQFDGAPRIDGALLRVTHDGYVPFSGSILENSGTGLAITLARPRSKDGLLRGNVVDASGAPVAKACVAFGVDVTKSEGDGSFAFPLEDPKSFGAQYRVPPTEVVAVKKGMLPARYVPPMTPGVDGKPAWPAMVVLRMGAEPLAIAGRVVDHKGRGMKGTSVWIADTTLLGFGKRGMMHLESVLAGAEDTRWRRIEADGQGRFRIDGLSARDYHVRAMDPNTLLIGEAGPFAAGTTNAEIRLATDTLHPLVAGRVVSQSGKPVAGARIFPMCDAFQARFKGQIISTSHEALDGTKTGEDGRFTMENVPESLVYLRVEGEDLLPLEYGRYVEGDERFVDTIRGLPKDKIQDLTIVVDLRCHLKIELADPSTADALSVLDKDGKALTISVFVGSGRRESPRPAIEDGRSFPMAVSETGKTLVLYKGDVEVSRTPLQLVPGEMKEIRL